MLDVNDLIRKKVTSRKGNQVIYSKNIEKLMRWTTGMELFNKMVWCNLTINLYFLTHLLKASCIYCKWACKKSHLQEINLSKFTPTANHNSNVFFLFFKATTFNDLVSQLVIKSTEITKWYFRNHCQSSLLQESLKLDWGYTKKRKYLSLIHI